MGVRIREYNYFLGKEFCISRAYMVVVNKLLIHNLPETNPHKCYIPLHLLKKEENRKLKDRNKIAIGENRI